MDLTRREILSGSTALGAASLVAGRMYANQGTEMLERARIFLAEISGQAELTHIVALLTRFGRGGTVCRARGSSARKDERGSKGAALDLLQDFLRDELKKGGADGNRERFFVLVFGTPGDAFWGNHLALNYALDGDEAVSVTLQSSRRNRISWRAGRTRFGWAGDEERGSVQDWIHGDTFLIGFATLRNQPPHHDIIRHDFGRNLGAHITGRTDAWSGMVLVVFR